MFLSKCGLPGTFELTIEILRVAHRDPRVEYLGCVRLEYLSGFADRLHSYSLDEFGREPGQTNVAWLGSQAPAVG